MSVPLSFFFTKVAFHCTPKINIVMGSIFILFLYRIVEAINLVTLWCTLHIRDIALFWIILQTCYWFWDIIVSISNWYTQSVAQNYKCLKSILIKIMVHFSLSFAQSTSPPNKVKGGLIANVKVIFNLFTFIIYFLVTTQENNKHSSPAHTQF